MLSSDYHVHSEWSWDADAGSMEKSCARAQSLGLPAIAFTEHADFIPWTSTVEGSDSASVRVIGEHVETGDLDVDGYRECLDRCRFSFPRLRILSGLELGEPHIFADDVAGILASEVFDRVLGSVHYIPWGGTLTFSPSLLTAFRAVEVMRCYFAELLRLVETCDRFDVLAHIDYPKRLWPKDVPPYNARDYEEEYRVVLRALARSERILEINTNGPCPGAEVVKWWYEEGGVGVSFGSDAHEPALIARGFDAAMAAAEASGFRPGSDPLDYWHR